MNSKDPYPCSSRYKTIHNNLATCDLVGGHTIHEGRYQGEWFTWRDEHAYKEPEVKPTWTPPKEKVTASEKQIGGDHYGSNLQPIDVIDAWKLDFYEGSALKCLARHRKKNGREDIQKAIHYLELLLERQYKNV